MRMAAGDTASDIADATMARLDDAVATAEAMAVSSVGGTTDDAVGTVIATGDDSNSATSGISLHTPLCTDLCPRGSALTPYEAEYPPLSSTHNSRVSSGQGSAILVDLTSRAVPPLSEMDKLMAMVAKSTADQMATMANSTANLDRLSGMVESSTVRLDKLDEESSAINANLDKHKTAAATAHSAVNSRLDALYKSVDGIVARKVKAALASLPAPVGDSARGTWCCQ